MNQILNNNNNNNQEKNNNTTEEDVKIFESNQLTDNWNDESDIEEKVQNPPPPIQEPPYIPNPQPKPSPTVQNYNNYNPHPKKRSAIPGIIAFIVVVVLLVLGIFHFVFSDKVKAERKAANNNTPAPATNTIEEDDPTKGTDISDLSGYNILGNITTINDQVKKAVYSNTEYKSFLPSYGLLGTPTDQMSLYVKLTSSTVRINVNTHNLFFIENFGDFSESNPFTFGILDTNNKVIPCYLYSIPSAIVAGKISNTVGYERKTIGNWTFYITPETYETYALYKVSDTEYIELDFSENIMAELNDTKRENIMQILVNNFAVSIITEARAFLPNVYMIPSNNYKHFSLDDNTTINLYDKVFITNWKVNSNLSYANVIDCINSDGTYSYKIIELENNDSLSLESTKLAFNITNVQTAQFNNISFDICFDSNSQIIGFIINTEDYTYLVILDKKEGYEQNSVLEEMQLIFTDIITISSPSEEDDELNTISNTTVR